MTYILASRLVTSTLKNYNSKGTRRRPVCDSNDAEEKRSFHSITLENHNNNDDEALLNNAINVMCTVGRGMEELASSEAARLTLDHVSVEIHQGRLYCKVKRECLPDFLRLSLSERVFLCPLIESIGISSAKEPIVSSITEALSSVDKSSFFIYLYHWYTVRLKEMTDPVTELNTFMNDLNSYVPSIKLIVKLRPKTLIKFTELVRHTVCRVLEERFNLTFATDATVEVNVMLSNGIFTVGLPLSGVRLSKRPYSVHVGLRSTTASAVAKSLKGEGIILDPMCGTASLLCEATVKLDCSVGKRSAVDCDNGQLPYPADFTDGHHLTYVIGSDSSLEQLSCAAVNLKSLEQSRSSSTVVHDLVLCDVLRLPFRDGVFDQLLCDLPFGHKHKIISKPDASLITLCHDDLASISLQWLRSMFRTLRPGASFGLLLPDCLRQLVEVELMSHSGNTRLNCVIDKCSPVSLGLTDALICSGSTLLPAPMAVSSVSDLS